MTDTQKKFIKNVKRYRKQQFLTQMELAELCKISTTYLGEIEIGRKYPSVEVFQRIADALKVKPHKLLLDDDSISDFDRKDFLTIYSKNLQQEIHATIETFTAKYIFNK